MATDDQNGIVLDAYAARLARRGLSPRTVKKYRAALAHYLAWLGGRRPEEATERDVNEYLDAWAVGKAPGSVRVRIAALRSFYRFLRSRGDVAANPVEDVERPRSRQRPNDWLSAEEDAALLDGAANEQERAVVHLLRWTGMRVGEACALTWDDVRLDEGEIRVRASKTDSGIRTVPVLPELDDELRAWRRHLERLGLHRPHGPVLATRHGTAMKEQFAWRLVKRVAGRAGVRARPAADASGWNVSEVTDHTLRRTFATDLLNRGVRLETVSKTLGHKDTRVTQQYYAELLDRTARDEILFAFRTG